MPRTPEDWRVMTQTLLIVNAACLILYTVAARVLGGNAATVSAVAQDAIFRHPEVALMVGLVIGHIVWPVWHFFSR
jgi:hypothetical protein